MHISDRSLTLFNLEALKTYYLNLVTMHMNLIFTFFFTRAAGIRVCVLILYPWVIILVLMF